MRPISASKLFERSVLVRALAQLRLVSHPTPDRSAMRGQSPFLAFSQSRSSSVVFIAPLILGAYSPAVNTTNSHIAPQDVAPKRLGEYPLHISAAGSILPHISSTNTTQGHRWHTARSEEHTSELQSRENLVCRLL